MTLLGKINATHVPINKYKLSIATIADIIFTKVSGIEQEVPGTILPDRSRATGGEPQPFELVCELPLHHATSVAALEAWFTSCKDPVTADYKKTGTMEYYNISATVSQTYTLSGMWITKLKYPDTDMSNEEGEMAVVEVTFSVDTYAAKAAA